MPGNLTIFEETYQTYLAQIAEIDFNSIQEKLGIRIDGDKAIIPLLGKDYRVTKDDITGPSGEQPVLEICVVLFRYLLMCPDNILGSDDWVSFRDLKDSGPLTVFFANDVEGVIAKRFSGRLKALEARCDKFGCVPPSTEYPYDLAMACNALPKIPLLILFNDADDEFNAGCSVLFKGSADQYLDAESLAILGALFTNNLKI